MQKVNNYGSLLQAFSLKKILQKLGHDVYFIDIKPNSEDNKALNNNAMTFQHEFSEYSSNPFISALKKINRTLPKRFLFKIKTVKLNNIFDDFRVKILGICGNENEQHYDCCVIGSDEVFNCMQKVPWGLTSQLYGNVDLADHVITYAASCGYATIENVPKEAIPIIKKGFDKVEAFSVRDVNTYNFVRNIIGEHDNRYIGFNLDPALIGDFDKYITMYGDGLKLPDKYCLIYAYSGRIYKKEDINDIKKFCKERNLKIVVAGTYQIWADNFLVANPFQLLWAFKHASFVLTDTFHGTIFSYKYSDRYAIIKRESNENKLGDLVNRLNIQNHLIEDFSRLNDVYQIKSKQEEVHSLINEQRNISINYLRNNLKNVITKSK